MAKLIYRFGYAGWLLGLLLPLLYVLAIAQIKTIVDLLRTDRWMQWLFGFIVFQVFVVFYNSQFEYASSERLVAAFHNIAAFGFLIVGFATASHPSSRAWLEKYAKEILLGMGLVVLVGSVYSWVTTWELKYDGLLARFIRNKFTEVRHNRLEISHWYFIPRTYAFHVYSNGTGMLLFSAFLFCMYSGWAKIKKGQRHALHALLVVLMFCTGSRMFLMFGLALWLLSFLRSFSQISRYRKWLIPLTLVGGGLAFVLFLFRGGSNATRYLIYSESLKFWWENAAVTGVGVKPILHGHSYPMGSHSTLVGYLFRFGIVGCLAVLIVYFKVFSKILSSSWQNLKNAVSFDARAIYLMLGCAMLLISTLLEDVDSYEYAAFYLGILAFYLKGSFTETPAVV